MVLFILNTFISFGDNFYEDDDGWIFQIFLAILTGIISAIVAFYAAWRQIKNQKKHEKDKEKERLESVRLQWYYSLIHLTKGIEKQIESIGDCVKSINEDLSKELKIKKSEYRKCATITDILPTLLFEFSTEDIFEIFVIKNSSEIKNYERQELYTKFYGSITFLKEFYTLLNLEKKNEGERADKRLSDFQNKLVEFDDEMKDAFLEQDIANNNIAGLELKYLDPLKKIYEHYREFPISTPEYVIENLLDPTLDSYIDKTLIKYMRVPLILQMCRRLKYLHELMIEDKKTLMDFYNNHLESLKKIKVDVIEKIINLEFEEELKQAQIENK